VARAVKAASCARWLTKNASGATNRAFGALERQGGKGRVNFADRISVEGQLDLKPHGGGGFQHIPQRGLGDPSICRIEEHSNTNGLRHQVMQQPQPLAATS